MRWSLVHEAGSSKIPFAFSADKKLGTVMTCNEMNTAMHRLVRQVGRFTLARSTDRSQLVYENILPVYA